MQQLEPATKLRLEAEPPGSHSVAVQIAKRTLPNTVMTCPQRIFVAFTSLPHLGSRSRSRDRKLNRFVVEQQAQRDWAN